MALKESFFRGILWSLFERFTGMFVQLVCSLIIARQLGPNEYGLVGMLIIFSSIALVIIDGGYRQALIQKQNCTDTTYNSAFYTNIFLGLLLYLILFFCSPYIANFYGYPQLMQLSWVLFALLPVASIGLIQTTILTKQMEFKVLAVVNILATSISGIIGVILAYHYKNAWALVVQLVMAQILQVTFVWIYGSWRPQWIFSIRELKNLFRFAFPLMLSQVMSAFFNNLYGLVIGKNYSALDLGLYTQARRLQEAPNTITDTVQKVGFPLLSTMQDDNEQLKSHYGRIFGLSLFIVVPTMFLLIGLAPNLFPVLLADQWLAAIPYFQILCINGALYPLSAISVNIFMVKGKGRLILYLEFLRKSIMIVCIIFTFKFSMLIFLYGYAFYSLVCALINLYFSGRLITFSLKAQILQYLPIFCLATLALLLCFLQQHYYLIASHYLQMGLTGTLFTLCYLCGAKLLKMDYFKEIIHLFQNVSGNKNNTLA